MNHKNDLRVFETPGLLSEAAAKFIVQLARESISERGRFAIALSGGNTPGKLYALLSTPAFKQQMDWEKTFVFWGDERCVPMNDERNNAFMAKLLLLNNIDIPAANIYPVQVNLPPAEAAEAYEQTLKTFFGKQPTAFDLILLGLGDNGHTASLFPGTTVLHEQKRLVKEVYVVEQQMFRITMTAPFINLANNIVFLVTGKEKAGVLKTVLNGPFEPDKYPAQLIKPVNGNLYWFADKTAANLKM